MGTLDFGGISRPKNQLTTKIRFWVQRAPSQSLPVKLEVRSGNQEEKKKEKKHAWVEHFTPTPKRRPFTYTFLFVHVGWGHQRNHPCLVSSQSVHQFRLPWGSKITISHRLGEWLLQQCYALTCYTVMVNYDNAIITNIKLSQLLLLLVVKMLFGISNNSNVNDCCCCCLMAVSLLSVHL